VSCATVFASELNVNVYIYMHSDALNYRGCDPYMGHRPVQIVDRTEKQC